MRIILYIPIFIDDIMQAREAVYERDCSLELNTPLHYALAREFGYVSSFFYEDFSEVVICGYLYSIDMTTRKKQRAWARGDTRNYSADIAVLEKLK